MIFIKEDSDKAEFTEEKALSFFARHLDDLNYPYRKSKKNPVLISSFHGEVVSWEFNVAARFKGDGVFHLSVNSFIPNNSRPERLAAVAELICRINYELRIGCFELNYTFGRILFRTDIILPGTDITSGIVEHLLKSNLSSVDERFLQIATVLHSNVTPKVAFNSMGAEECKPLPPAI